MIPFDPATVDIDAMLKRLHLANTRRCWPTLTEQATSEQWSHRDFLAILLAEEIGHRHGTRLRRATHDARHAGDLEERPSVHALSGFRWSHDSARQNRGLPRPPQRSSLL
jgi:hypothetical protein